VQHAARQRMQEDTCRAPASLLSRRGSTSRGARRVQQAARLRPPDTCRTQPDC
jgi:hypothetical protein